MDNPEERFSGSDEMGSGREVYSQLDDSSLESGHAETPESGRYRALADAARTAGDTELADRLAQHAIDLEAAHEEWTRRSIGFARQQLEDLTREGAGRKYLTIAVPGEPYSDALLPRIRSAMLESEDLSGAKVERTADPEAPGEYIIRYVVPIGGGMLYSESYSEHTGVTAVEISKL